MYQMFNKLLKPMKKNSTNGPPFFQRAAEGVIAVKEPFGMDFRGQDESKASSA
jgi:hypothetical protein